MVSTFRQNPVFLHKYFVVNQDYISKVEGSIILVAVHNSFTSKIIIRS